MSLESHKGQVLPLKNRTISADKNTVFLAHYDLIENDVLTGIPPIPTPVATLRPDGYHGGAIAVDDGTTNLVTNSTNPSSWGSQRDPAFGFISEQVVTTELGTLGFQKTFTGSDFQGTRIHTGSPSFTFANGDYTVSFYAKADKQINVMYQLQTVDGNGARLDLSTNDTISTEWKRLVYTVNPVAAGAVSCSSLGVKIYPQTGVDPATITVTMPQIEQKSFPTSFVSGTRAISNLQYVVPISPNNFTLSFWAKVNGYSGSNPFYIQMYTTSPISANNRVFIRPTDLVTISAGRVVGGTITRTPDGTIEDVRQWHMYTLTSSGTTMKVYQDGKMISSSSSIPTLTGSSVTLELSGDDKLYSVMFDELRIDKIARTDDEILAWYYSNSPFWPRGMYTVGY